MSIKTEGGCHRTFKPEVRDAVLVGSPTEQEVGVNNLRNHCHDYFWILKLYKVFGL